MIETLTGKRKTQQELDVLRTQKRSLEPMAGRNSSGRFTISGSLWAWAEEGGAPCPHWKFPWWYHCLSKAHSLQSQLLLTKTYLEFVECHRLGVNSSKHPHPSLQNLSEWISHHHRLTLCWMLLFRCGKSDPSLRYQLMPSLCYLYLSFSSEISLLPGSLSSQSDELR